MLLTAVPSGAFAVSATGSVLSVIVSASKVYRNAGSPGSAADCAAVSGQMEKWPGFLSVFFDSAGENPGLDIRLLP